MTSENKIVKVVNERESVGMTATITSRFSFTGQFILGARHFASLAAKIEKNPDASQDERTHHMAYVAAAIMQSTAALESEVWQIICYGPGQHLGSNEIDTEARNLLVAIKDEIDSLPVLRRYEVILHLLDKEPMEKGHKPYQQASVLIQLRNAITHYKSMSGPEMDEKKLYTTLEQLGHKPPQFAYGSINFFPHKCLSAECADWAWRTADKFLTEFSNKLGKPSVLDGYLDRV